MTELVKYLEEKQWKEKLDFPNNKVRVFEKAYEDDEYTIVLPRKQEYKDYKKRLEAAIETISELEEIGFEEITKQIHQSNNSKVININKKDKINFRIISNEVEDGTMPIEYAANVVEGMKKLVASSIYTEKTRRKHFLQAGKLLELSNYRLGQSKVGSYIFTLEVDIYSKQVQMKLGDEVDELDDSRKVIRRIQNGLSQIANAKNEKDIDRLMEKGFVDGLNANMCEAILKLKNADNMKLETTIEWADNVVKPKGIVEKVTLTNKDFYLIQGLIEKYKEEPSKIIELEGYVYALHNKEKGHGEERYIMLSAEVDGKNRSIKIDLSAEDYYLACEAHSRTSKVKVKGEIDSIGKNLTLYNYSEFIILNNDKN